MRFRIQLGLGSVFAVTIHGAMGCSASDTSRDRAGASAIAGTSSASTTGGTGGTGGILPPGTGGSSIIVPTQGNDASSSADGACASTGAKATPTSIDLYVMLDQSGSMQGGGANSGPRWDPVTTALKGFIGDPKSAGIGVGIQYFPLGTGTTMPDLDKCLVSKYQQPDVAIALLPGNAAALVASIDGHYFTSAQANDGPHYGTPTRPALEGAVNHVRDFLQKNPDHTGVVLLATDGYPSSSMCTPDPDDIKSIVAIAQMAAAWTPPVRTYVIGIGDLKNLNAVAAAGGTGQSAFIVDGTGQQTQQQFAAALDAIRTSVIPCDYPIPSTDPNGFDLNQVNVDYRLASASAPVVIGKAIDAAACQNQEGWYFDDPTRPTKVVMCPATCTTLQKDRASTVDVLFGCPTIVIH